MEQKYYTLPSAAKVMGIKVRTLRQWIREGKLPEHRYPNSRRYFLTKEEIEGMSNNDN